MNLEKFNEVLVWAPEKVEHMLAHDVDGFDQLVDKGSR